MDISRQDRVRMERAHVLAWPALHSATVEGWLWRSSGGGSQRANSVSTIDFFGSDVAKALAEIEGLYEAKGAPARFHTFDETSPSDLAEHLQGWGYQQAEPTVTMFKRLGETAAVSDVEIKDHAWTSWRQVYLDEITQDRRVVNSIILKHVRAPRAFFGRLQDKKVVSTALCVIGFGCAVVECVATQTQMRRQGAARAILSAVEHWASKQQADIIGLQVAQRNLPAMSLYRSLGFTAGAVNRFWIAREAPS